MLDLDTAFFKTKLIVSEVDGILTSGHIYVDELGNIPFKMFNTKDFEAINLLKKYFKIIFLSSDNKINYNFFRRLNIPFFYNNKNKKSELIQILNKYQVTPEEIIYIGSTYSDVLCMQMIPLSFCPEMSVYEVMNLASMVISICGGDGVFIEIYNLLKKEINKRISG